MTATNGGFILTPVAHTPRAAVVLTCALTFAYALLAGSSIAHAQVPGLPPILPAPQGPPASQPAPLPPLAGKSGQAVAYRLDGGRTGVSGDDSLIPPLGRRWSRRLGLRVSYSLIAGRRIFVLVETVGGDKLVSLDAASGRVRWSRPFSGPRPGSLNIAYGDGRLFALSVTGTAQALDPASGRTLWSYTVPGTPPEFSDPPILAGGLLVFGSESGHTETDNGRVVALRAADGSVAWQITSAPGAPVTDGTRIYLGGSCAVRALRPSDGTVLWQRGELCSNSINEELLAADGRVYVRESVGDEVLDAATGRVLLSSAFRGAVTTGNGFVLSQLVRDEELRAQDPSGKRIWSFGRSESCITVCHAPVVSGEFVYVAKGGKLSARELRTGRRRWLDQLASEPSYDNRSKIGMSIGEGVLAVPDGPRLVAYSSLLRPPATGAFLLAPSSVITFGDRVRLIGAVGRTLRRQGRHRVALEADPFPFRRHRRADAVRSRSDATFALRVSPTRNTRYRTLVRGRRDVAGTLFVLPRFDQRLRRGAGGNLNRITASVTANGPRDIRLGGRRVHLYLARVAERRVVRVGSGRLRRAGAGKARGQIRFAALRGLGRRDYLFYCSRGLSRVGLGPRSAVDRRCGAPRLPF